MLYIVFTVKYKLYYLASLLFFVWVKSNFGQIQISLGPIFEMPDFCSGLFANILNRQIYGLEFNRRTNASSHVTPDVTPGSVYFPHSSIFQQPLSLSNNGIFDYWLLFSWVLHPHPHYNGYMAPLQGFEPLILSR
jgi:hypothetical protein